MDPSIDSGFPMMTEPVEYQAMAAQYTVLFYCSTIPNFYINLLYDNFNGNINLFFYFWSCRRSFKCFTINSVVASTVVPTAET